MKILAYRDQYGFDAITPLSARHQNLKTVYSRHREGQRLPMYVNRRGSTFFFAYKPEHHQNATSEPESLTHSLCKMILKELADQQIQTELHLTYQSKRWERPIPLRFISGSFEHKITTHQGKAYYIDTFCQFSQNFDNNLLKTDQCRWQGSIAFEFYHRNGLAANSPKCQDLTKLGIPIIQIAARKGDFLYFDEAELLNKSNEEIEESLQNYKQKIRNTFKKRIIGVLLNNPQSDYFKAGAKLYQQIQNQQQCIIKLEEQLQQLHNSEEEKTQKIKYLETAYEQLLFKLKEIHTKNHQPSPKAEAKQQSWWEKIKTSCFRLKS